MNKQSFLALARKMGLLPALDAVRFIRSKWQSAADNQKFLERHPEFVQPPLWWMHDMYRHTSFELYWKTGQATAAAIQEKIDSCVDVKEPCVADWGCGLGRVLRHMPSSYRRYGFDYNATAINWCTNNIAGAQFARNDLNPPLPAKNESFDTLYALSVFTHLSAEGHKNWIAEIERVLKPGGVFLGAFHMQLPSEQLLPHEQAQFDHGALVVRGGVKEGSRTYVAYHPEAYLRDDLLQGFEIIEPPLELLGQSLIIARKPF